MSKKYLSNIIFAFLVMLQQWRSWGHRNWRQRADDSGASDPVHS